MGASRGRVGACGLAVVSLPPEGLLRPSLGELSLGTERVLTSSSLWGAGSSEPACLLQIYFARSF